MKKILTLGLILLTLIGLTACSKNEKEPLSEPEVKEPVVSKIDAKEYELKNASNYLDDEGKIVFYNDEETFELSASSKMAKEYLKYLFNYTLPEGKEVIILYSEENSLNVFVGSSVDGEEKEFKTILEESGFVLDGENHEVEATVTSYDGFWKEAKVKVGSIGFSLKSDGIDEGSAILEYNVGSDLEFAVLNLK